MSDCMSKINIAVIPIAGYGSRMFPETLLINKCLLPIGNKPTILFLLEEIIESDIHNVFIIINEHQKNIIDVLKTISLSNYDSKYHKQIQDFNNIISQLNINYIIQKEQKGLANALYSLKEIIKEPFALLLGDNVILPKECGLKSLLNYYDKLESNILLVSEVPKEKTNLYGIIETSDSINPLHVTSINEKPKYSKSNLACVGRYILNNSIIESIEKDINIDIEPLLPNYIFKERTYAILNELIWIDVGNEDSYLEGNIKYYKYKNKL